MLVNAIKCGIGDCPSVFQTEEALSPNARYVCRLHSKTEQTVFFQDAQFDKGLKMAKKPQGTTHIKNQGSEIMTAEDVDLAWSWREAGGEFE